MGTNNSHLCHDGCMPFHHHDPKHTYYVFVASTSTLHTVDRETIMMLLDEYLTVGYVHPLPHVGKHSKGTEAEIWTMGEEGSEVRVGTTYFPKGYIAGGDFVAVMKSMPEGLQFQNGALSFIGF